MSDPSSSSGAADRAAFVQMQQQMQQMQVHMQNMHAQHAQQLAAAAGGVPRPTRPKLPSVTPFSVGAPQVEPFLRTMEQHMKYYNIATEEDKLQFVSGHLTGAALV